MSQSYVKNLGFDKTSGSWQNLECTPTGILYSRIDGNVVVQGLQFSNTGALITTSAGGGGTGGDASSSNQLTQISLATALNDIIAIDTNGRIDTTNSYLNDLNMNVATGLNQIETNTKLENIYGQIETTNSKLDDVITNINLTNVLFGENNGELINVNTNLADIKFLTELTNANLQIIDASLFQVITQTTATANGIADANNTLQSIDTNMATSALQTDIKNELITLNNTGLATDASVVSVEANLLLILDELQNGTIAVDTNEPWEFDPTDGGLVVHVANSGGTGGDASAALQQDQLDQAIEANVAVCLRLDAINGVIDSIDGKITTCDTSTLLTEATFEASNTAVCIRLDGSNSILQDFQTNGIKSLVYGGGFPIDSTMYTTGRQALSVSIENNAVECSVNNFPTTYATDATLTASNTAVCLRLDEINTSIQGLTPGGSSNSNVVVLNNSLDVHCYGSVNGTTWHHLKVDSNGILNTHSMTQSGLGDDITSHDVGAYRGLDSYIINDVLPVDNSEFANFSTMTTLLTDIEASTGALLTNSDSSLSIIQDIKLNTDFILAESTAINSNVGLILSNSAAIATSSAAIQTNTDTLVLDTADIKTDVGFLAGTIANNCQQVSLHDQAGNALTSVANGLSQSLHVALKDGLGNSIYSASNRLYTDALLRTATSAIASTGTSLNVNTTNFPVGFEIYGSGGAALNATSGALNSYITNFPSVYKRILPVSSQGSFGNLQSAASVAPGASSAILDVSNYTDSTISYEDQSPANTSTIIIYGTTSLSAPIDLYYIGRLIPIAAASTTKRFAVARFALGPWKGVYAVNDSTTDTNLVVRISVVSEGST